MTRNDPQACAYVRQVLGNGILYCAEHRSGTWSYFTVSKGAILRITNKLRQALRLPSMHYTPDALAGFLREARLAPQSLVTIDIHGLQEAVGWGRS